MHAMSRGGCLVRESQGTTRWPGAALAGLASLHASNLPPIVVPVLKGVRRPSGLPRGRGGEVGSPARLGRAGGSRERCGGGPGCPPGASARCGSGPRAGGEDLRVETRVAERAGAGFPRPVLPGTARCDAARGPAAPLQPGAHRARGARRAGVGAAGGRRAARHAERRPPGEDVVGAPAPGPAVLRPLGDEVVGPDGVRPLGAVPRAGAVRGPASPPARGVAGQAPPRLTPQPLHPLGVHPPALGPQQGRDAPGAGPADAAGPGDDPGDQGGGVRRHPGGGPLRAARRGEDPTGPTLRDDQRGPRGRARLAPARRAQKVPDATSVRMAVSSAWSATSFFRRPFARSRSVRRCAWSTRRPPSSRRPRESVCSATPRRRATVPTFSPWARATSSLPPRADDRLRRVPLPRHADSLLTGPNPRTRSGPVLGGQVTSTESVNMATSVSDGPLSDMLNRTPAASYATAV